MVNSLICGALWRNLCAVDPLPDVRRALAFAADLNLYEADLDPDQPTPDSYLNIIFPVVWFQTGAPRPKPKPPISETADWTEF